MQGKTHGNKLKLLKKVKVHYTGRLADGTVFDSSRDKEPFTVPLGQKRVIRGFEDALKDLVVGDAREVTIPPEKAYGPYRKELVTEVARSMFSQSLALREGQHLQLKNPDGIVTTVRVKKLGEEKVTLDANHPLAGKTLVFDIEVLEIHEPREGAAPVIET
jgi:peptidylprolyl isomerase